MNLLSAQPLTSPILIGRTQEVVALNELIASTKRGQGRVALISGEAGVGKSRLVTLAKSAAFARTFCFYKAIVSRVIIPIPMPPFLTSYARFLPRILLSTTLLPNNPICPNCFDCFLI
jgi:hypothetical protein